MKKRIISAVVLIILIFNILPNTFSGGLFSLTAAAAEPPQLKSEAAILIDAESGRVIFEKNCDEVLYPASTTKMMTAILVLENLQLDTVVVASRQAVLSIPAGGSNMGLVEGEQLTVEQLLYGVLIASANEACNVLAEYMCGDTDEFVVLMNKKAAELGMTNTKYLNTHGLHVPEHHSTARDLAILAQYAMQNKKFRDMVATSEYLIEPTEKYPQERRMYNTNYLISSKQNASYYYPKAIGIKTGYTSQAGNCLVSAATHAGTEFIAVTLNAAPQTDAIYSFIDSKALLEYGFANYKRKVIAVPGKQVRDGEASVKEAQGNNYVRLNAATELSAVVESDRNVDNLAPDIVLNGDIRAPIAQGEVLGVATYSYVDEKTKETIVLGSVDLVAGNDVKLDFFVFLMNKIFEFLGRPYVAIPLAILIILFTVLYIMRKINRRKRRSYLRSQRYSAKNK